MRSFYPLKTEKRRGGTKMLHKKLAFLLIILLLLSCGFGCGAAESEISEAEFDQEISGTDEKSVNLKKQTEIFNYTDVLLQNGMQMNEHYGNLGRLYSDYEDRNTEWIGEVASELEQIYLLAHEIEELKTPEALGGKDSRADRLKFLFSSSVQNGANQTKDGLVEESDNMFQMKISIGMQSMEFGIEKCIELMNLCHEVLTELQSEFEDLS
jgi:hypothetical protein